MATTSPDNIWSPDSGDDYALTVDLAAMADTVQDAITANNNDLRGLDSERPPNGAPGLAPGMTWYSTDTGVTWRYIGTSWSIEFRPLSAYPATIVGLPSGVTTATKYEQRGKLVHVEVEIIRTASGRPNATVSISLPIGIINPTTPKSLGIGLFNLQGGSQYDVRARYAGGSAVVVNFPGVSGSALASGQNLTADFPTSAAHGVGTSLHLSFDYEVA